MIGQRTARRLWRVWHQAVQPNIDQGVRLLQAERYRWMQRLGVYSSDLASTHAAIPDVARRWLLRLSYVLRTKGAGVRRRTFEQGSKSRRSATDGHHQVTGKSGSSRKVPQRAESSKAEGKGTGRSSRPTRSSTSKSESGRKTGEAGPPRRIARKK